MNRSATTEIKENYRGKVSYYIFKKNKRNPVFLQRNIRRVLAVHRKQIRLRQKGKQRTMKGPVQARNGHKEAPPVVGKHWTPREISSIIERRSFSDRDPVLRIDVTAIRDRRAKFKDLREEDEPPRKQAKTSPIEALCALTIWDSTSGKLDTVVEQTRRCAIHQLIKDSDERSASTELSEPFIVPLRKLTPKRERASQTYGEHLFSMQLALMAANTTDPWPPVETNMPPPKIPQYQEQTGHLVRFPILVAKWQRLPRLPADKNESLLELFASQDSTKYKPKLSLEIDAQWLEAPSPLTVYNSEWRNGLVSPESSSRSTSTHDRRSSRSMVKIEWIFEGLASFMDPLYFDGYICPLCDNQQFHDAGEFHFHLITYHDMFKFKFSLKFEVNHLGHSIGEGIIRVEIADSYEKRTLVGKKVPDFRELTWVRPDCPFDLEAFLKGDESWIRKPAWKSNLLVPQQQLDRSSSREAGRDVPISAIIRPPDQVPNLSVSARKKFRVPAAPPGLKFYRTIAKCPLEEGDYVSESDEDIDDEWLLEKHSDTIDSFTDTLPQEKQFMQVYDRHMLREDTSCDLHAGEALIRFCRAKKDWLQNPSMKFEFIKKAATLKLQCTLSPTVIRACMAIINSPVSQRQEIDDTMDIDSEPLSPIPKTNETNGHVSSQPSTKAADTYRPLTPPETGHVYGRCAECHTAILDMRKSICCANDFCPHPYYHLSCVKLTQRNHSWACNECKLAGYGDDSKEPSENVTQEASAAAAANTPSHAFPLSANATLHAPRSPPHLTSAAPSAPTPTSRSTVENDNLALRHRESSLVSNRGVHSNGTSSRHGSATATAAKTSNRIPPSTPGENNRHSGSVKKEQITAGQIPKQENKSPRNAPPQEKRSGKSQKAEPPAKRQRPRRKENPESMMGYMQTHEDDVVDLRDVSDGDYKESEHGDAGDRDEFMEIEDWGM